MKFSKVLLVIFGTVLLVACSGDGKKKGPVESVDDMYNSGISNLEKRKYEKAIEKFEELERTYPYSEWATKSEIMSAYASYKDEKYDAALITLERFTKLHPGNKDIAYAYYLKALSFYQQISDVERDQSYSQYARAALEEVIARFPDTKYANDARLKLDLVVGHLAGKEVEIGRFYQSQGNYIGAINRFKKVIDDYDTTAHTSEALHRLVESYTALGVRDEAVKYASVLGYNYPDSKWYARSYKILEGKKLTDETEEQKKGKWYDFAALKNIRKMGESSDSDSDSDSDINTDKSVILGDDDLIEGYKDVSVQDVGNVGADAEVVLPTEVSDDESLPSQEIKKKSKLKALGGWFKGLFSR